MEYLLCTKCCVKILYISSFNLVSSLLRHYINHLIIMLCWGFPGGMVVENLPANAGDTGSSPGLGRSHMPLSN